MTAPASEDLRELERLLTVAAETGEMRSRASLQEELGIGADSLETALDVLREHGKAVEAAPGEWRGPSQDEIDTHDRANGAGEAEKPPRVLVSVGDDEAPVRESGWSDVLTAEASVEPTVRLTMAIAKALDAAAIGALIKAGIDDADSRDEAFVLEVLP